jgi:hypothetical protein
LKGAGVLRQLRGRNLSHIGCTLGLLAGLCLGLVLALVALRLSPSVTAAFAVFAGATVVLGAVGYFLGVVATRRFADRGDPGR